MKTLLQKLIQAIKSLWEKIVNFFKKLFGKEEKPVFSIDEPKIEETPPPPPPPVAATHQEAIRMKHGREGKQELLECFFGTLIPRPPEEGSLKKVKHAKDGWRHGVSHPFTFRNNTYDVQYNNDASLDLFDTLMKMLTEMEAGE